MNEILLQPTPSVSSFEIVDYLDLNYNSIIESLDISEKSKVAYKSTGKDFLNFVIENGITIDTYRLYKGHLLKRTDIKEDSKKQKLITAKAILDNLTHHRRLLQYDITKGVKCIKTDTGHKKDGHNEHEIRKIKYYIDLIEDENKKVRIKAMFYLLMLQGLREFEMCNILIDDVNLNDRQISVKGKGYESKSLIDLHPDTCTALKNYLVLSNKKSGYLFTSEKGTTIGEKLTERGLRKIFDTIFEKLDIERCVHGLRHFFVTRMLEATNGNVGVVKQFSRHKSIQALMMYDDRKRKKEQLPMYYDAFNNI